MHFFLNLHGLLIKNRAELLAFLLPEGNTLTSPLLLILEM